MATVDRMSKHRKASRHLTPALWVGGFLLLGVVVALIALAQPNDPLDRPNVVPGGSAEYLAERVNVAQVASRDQDRLERYLEQKKQARIEARKEARKEERQEARRQERQAERQEVREAEQTESVSTTTPVPTSTSTAGNRALGQEMMLARGWGMDQWPCLEQLWTHESGWRTTASNSSSGAYGIPQALPGSKMAVAGSDWQTNPATQIRWGLTYISGRYGSPCGAWGFFQANNWY